MRPGELDAAGMRAWLPMVCWMCAASVGSYANSLSGNAVNPHEYTHAASQYARIDLHAYAISGGW